MSRKKLEGRGKGLSGEERIRKGGKENEILDGNHRKHREPFHQVKRIHRETRNN